MDNPHNRLITKKEVENILNYYGGIADNNERLLINDLSFYQLAFVHESYNQSILQQDDNSNKKYYLNYLPNNSNERLEFLGDNILKASLGRYLYERYNQDYREGMLTKLKIKIEQCSMLHKFAVELGFKKFLLLSLQIENQSILSTDRGRSTPGYYEDAFESFLGSIMEDFGEKGYVYCERFLRNIIENVIDFSELISNNNNQKDSLQRFFQSNKWKTPIYKTIEEIGPLYRKVFTRMLVITKEQFCQLFLLQQQNITSYTEECIEYYKLNNPEIFKTLLKQIIEENNYILSLGIGKKIVNAEQNCASKGLENLMLDANY